MLASSDLNPESPKQAVWASNQVTGSSLPNIPKHLFPVGSNTSHWRSLNSYLYLTV